MGETRMLHRVVNVLRFDSMSSSERWCRTPPAPDETVRVCWEPVPVCVEGLFSISCFSTGPVCHRRSYISPMSVTTVTRGPAKSTSVPPYRTMATNAQSRRKLSHVSPVDHVNNPTSWFSGCMKLWEYAKARVTCGGVATSRGDFC